MLKPIVIVGGGLAGLTLGIGLRQRNVPAIVWEAGHYPRQRVCGEFISGRGQETLERLGLLPILYGSGARLAQTAAFYSVAQKNGRESPALPLPQPAICLSRRVLDAALADEFRRLGGVLLENERWSQQTSEGVVWAAGRRVAPGAKEVRWIGIKAHACGVTLTADLETHLGPFGYVGLCRLNDDQTNVCALLRARGPVAHLAETWEEYLRGPEGSPLREHMAHAQFVPGSFCSTAGISLKPCKASANADFRIGDALTMIPPITGNGMSMAFEAAGLALEPLAAYSHGALTWADARRTAANRCDHAFTRRLRCSALLHCAVFRPRLLHLLIAAIAASPTIWKSLFKLTR